MGDGAHRGDVFVAPAVRPGEGATGSLPAPDGYTLSTSISMAAG